MSDLENAYRFVNDLSKKPFFNESGPRIWHSDDDVRNITALWRTLQYISSFSKSDQKLKFLLEQSLSLRQLFTSTNLLYKAWIREEKTAVTAIEEEERHHDGNYAVVHRLNQKLTALTNLLFTRLNGDRLVLPTIVDVGDIKVNVTEGLRFSVIIRAPDIEEHDRAEALILNDKGTHSQNISEVERRTLPRNAPKDLFRPGQVSINCLLALRPGNNSIVIRLYEKGQVAVDGTVGFYLDGRAYTSQGAEFLLQRDAKHVQNKALDKIAALASEMNEHLNEPVSSIFIHDQQKPYGRARGRTVELSRYNWTRTNDSPEAIAWHELAHLYYNELRGSERAYFDTGLWQPYGQELGKLYDAAIEMSLVEGGDKIRRRWEDIKPNSVILIFNSHHYRDHNLELGHPQNDDGELFAYGSEILKYFRKQFLEKVAELETSGEKSLALEILKKIESAYRQAQAN